MHKKVKLPLPGGMIRIRGEKKNEALPAPDKRKIERNLCELDETFHCQIKKKVQLR
jgi:hypothetical protein